jgi:acetyltransferase-like isoleucine patch superfamily enzyme
VTSIHASAHVSASAIIGRDTRIHENVVVRENVQIGEGCIIHPNVVLEAGTRLGKGVVVFPNTYIGKIPHGAGATARPLVFGEVVSIGDGCAIGPNAVIYKDVQIDRNTLLGDGASVREQVRIGHHCIISRYVTVNYNTRIGSNTKIMDGTHITGNCSIGEDVFIGMLVSTANDNDLRARKYEAERIVGPTIENRATIGTCAVILPGIRIGAGGTVAANAVVVRDVAPGTIVAGVPARLMEPKADRA